MIDGLTKSLESADPAARIDCGPEDDFLKEIDRQMLGTGESEKETAGVEMFQGVQIKKFVSASGSFHITSFMG